MAVEQALTLTRTTFLCTPKTPLSTHTLPLSLNPRPHSHPLRQQTLTLKSSISDYTNTGNGYYTSVEYERPPEIQWKKELCNSIQLIGVVATPVQIKQLAGGKAVAWSRLAVKKSAADTSWINLTFWDELAHVAWQHIEKGNQIYVSGRLVSDVVESEDGKQQTYYKVVVQQLNFIERSFPSVSLYDGEPGSEITGKKNLTVNTTGSTQELWQAFFANPVDWWDNRKDKRNPKYPDFKHKDTGEALWIEGRNNPSWVKSQLAILDSKMEAHQQNDGTSTNFFTSF